MTVKKRTRIQRPAQLVSERSGEYPARSERTHQIIELAREIGRQATVAGRVLFAESNYFLLGDEGGTLKVLSPEIPDIFSLVEVSGLVVRGAEGAPELRASSGRELSPALRAPRGERQWERLALEPPLRAVFRARAAILAEVRRFFSRHGFLEVDTPALVAAPGTEPYLDPLESRVFSRGGGEKAGYLITSPEYALKKLLAAGFERVFEIARVFRNGEPLGGLHNPEFLMLEWYRSYASYHEIMDDVEELVRHLARWQGKSSFRVRGSEVDLGGRFERLSVAEALQKYAAVDLEKNFRPEELRRTIRAKGYRPADSERYEDLFFRLFLNEVEPCLGRRTPTILYDWPAELASLARSKPEDPRLVERFELYLGGIELANAFSELNDPVEQEARLRAELALRKKLGKRVFAPDQDFLDALRTGMPPAGGIALGLDRLIMVLLEKERIEDVRLFPAAEMFSFTKRSR